LQLHKRSSPTKRRSEDVSEMARRGAALVVLMTMLAAGVAFGEYHGPCYGAYLESGLTEQQMDFDRFRRFYADTLCARNSTDLGATHEGRVLGETR
jgi:hypothetical protein